MALYTPLPLAEADAITRAHGLGPARAVHPILAGSVNSNFFLDADRRVFARIYEEQETDGVAYEWALLDHLGGAGLPVPRRVLGPAPGQLRVAGKPVGVFEAMGGEESCQAGVTEARIAALGRFLAESHAAGATFPTRREGRFGLATLRPRLEALEAAGHADLADVLPVLRESLDEIDAGWDATLPGGVVHGDLFRDNVRWEGDRIVGALDWESAADGTYVYDLAVCALSWCYGAAFEPNLLAGLGRAYHAARPLEPREKAALRLALMAGAVRFTLTRITDYHLRKGSQQVFKDYRRFVDRLLAVRSMDDAAEALGLAG